MLPNFGMATFEPFVEPKLAPAESFNFATATSKPFLAICAGGAVSLTVDDSAVATPTIPPTLFLAISAA